MKESEIISPQRKAESPPNKDEEGTLETTLVTPEVFYQTINDNNLLRPLGWQRQTPPPKYMLLGTMIVIDSIQDTKTFIWERQSEHLHSVGINDQIGEVFVKKIEAKQVILPVDDKEIILEKEQHQFF